MASAGGRFSVFRNRNFTLLWSGLIVSNAGSWMQIVAQGILVYHISESPFLLGLVGVSRAVPMIVIPPFGGVIADRVSRLKLLKLTQTLSFLVALALAVLTSAGVIEIWQIVVIGVLSGAVNAFDQPTRQALLPDLVREEDLSRAIALNSSAWQGSALFGPTLAGVAVATMGIAGAFYINAFSFLAVVAALFMMRGVPERSGEAEPSRTISNDLAAGLSYVRRSSLIFALLVLASITSVFGRSYQQLLPVFAVDIFHKGGLGYGLLLAMPGAGTLCGALGLAVLRDFRSKGMLFLGGTLAFSAILIAFALNRSFAAGLALLFLSGLASLVFATMMTTILQLRVPNNMRGRVMALVTVTMQGFSPLGGLLTGALASAVGTPEAVAACAAVVGAAALFALVWVPAVRDFTHQEAEPRPQDAPAERPAAAWQVAAEAAPAEGPGAGS